MPVIDREKFLNDLPVHDVLHKLRDEHEIITGTNGWVTVRCCNPEHPDKHPSCAVNTQTKKYKCSVCGDNGDLITFVQKVLEAANRSEAIMWLRKTFSSQVFTVIPEAQVVLYHEILKRTPIKLKFLRDAKGINDDIVKRYQIGLRDTKYTIPIKEDGECVNVRFYQPSAKDNKFKFTNTQGAKGKALYPIEELENDVLILTEGELKALLLIQHGFNAITTTCGAATWDDDWSELFENKTVFIIYDVDQAGVNNAKKIAYRLTAAGASVHIVNLPISRKDYKGKGDVTNYFVDEKHSADELKQLLADTELFVPLCGRKALLDDKSITPVTLRRMTEAEYSGRRVRVKGITQVVDRESYQIPKKLRVECDRSFSVCGLCNVTKKGNELAIDEEDLAVLELVHKPNVNKSRVLKESLGIPLLCSKAEFNVLESVNVQSTEVIPEESLSDVTQTVSRRLFCLSNTMQVNQPYLFEARVWPHPDTQAAVGIAYKTESTSDSLEKFELTEEDKVALKIFQGGKEKLDEIANWQSTNITQIYQRPDLHLLVDVVFHSVLEIPFENKTNKGWVDAIIVGDSGQGKTEVTSNLVKHYKSGGRVDMKSTSVAGLKGTTEQVNGRWQSRPGRLAQYDKRLLILEECKGQPPEVYAALTDVRSIGYIELIKAGMTRLSARVRLLWVSNPRYDRGIKTYPQGVLAIKELIGALEDIRRFDIAMCVASGEVNKEVLNSVKPRDQTDKFPSGLCEKLVKWCWSRRAKDIIILEETKNAIYETSKQLSEKYHSKIPLVEPADQRYKVLRIACAIAARLFSTEDGEQLIVLPLHVELATNLLQRCYDSEAMRYDEFSETVRDQGELKNVQEIRTEINGIVHREDFVKGIKSRNVIRKSDLKDLTLFDDDEIASLTNLLVRSNAFTPYRSGYIKGEAFIEFLNTWVKEKKPEHIPVEEVEERF